MVERDDDRDEPAPGEGAPGDGGRPPGEGGPPEAASHDVAPGGRESEGRAPHGGPTHRPGRSDASPSGPPRATAPPGGFSPKTLELLAERGIEVRVHELGGRGARLLAVLLDSSITFLATVLVLMTFRREMFAAPPGQGGLELGLPDTVGFFGVQFLVYMLLHGPFLARTGQSIGKRVLRLRIADSRDGSVPDLMRILLRRMLPFYVLQLIPSIGAGVLVGDSVGIFGRDRRCLHDLVAGTVVVRA